MHLQGILLHWSMQHSLVTLTNGCYSNSGWLKAAPRCPASPTIDRHNDRSHIHPLQDNITRMNKEYQAAIRAAQVLSYVYILKNSLSVLDIPSSAYSTPIMHAAWWDTRSPHQYSHATYAFGKSELVLPTLDVPLSLLVYRNVTCARRLPQALPSII
jgi:hypothetical protein